MRQRLWKVHLSGSSITCRCSESDPHRAHRREASTSLSVGMPGQRSSEPNLRSDEFAPYTIERLRTMAIAAAEATSYNTLPSP